MTGASRSRSAKPCHARVNDGRPRGTPAAEHRASARSIGTHKIAAEGFEVFFRYSVRAPARRLRVVLVHGLGLSGRYMLPTAEPLAPHFPVYVPDLPGFGDSEKPAHALDVPALAEALAAWLRAAGLVRVALLGNWFGCQIIADLGARHPELVERAVLQGPTTPPDERSWGRRCAGARTSRTIRTRSGRSPGATSASAAIAACSRPYAIS